jgi:hypothetical protein
LKGTHPGTIPARFGLIWFSSFRGRMFYELWTFADFHRWCKLVKRGVQTTTYQCCNTHLQT